MNRFLIVSAFLAFVAMGHGSASAQGEQEDSCLRQVAFCVEGCSKLAQDAVAGCTENCRRDIPCPTESEPQTDLPKSKLPGSDLPDSSMPDSDLSK